MRADGQHRARRNRRRRCKCTEHCGCGFPRGNDIHGGCAPQILEDGPGQRALDEPTRVDAVNGSAKNCAEILSESEEWRSQLINLARVSPGGQPGNQVELPQDPADDLVGPVLRAQTIQLRHDP
jgi:hypothetical protein